jgi:DivIVA domain-containing protein
MPLTPADVHHVVFNKPKAGKRGYDEAEVDAFVDVVEAELTRLVEENNQLRAGRGTMAAAASSATQPPDDDSARTSRMLALANETADRFVGEAKQQAEQMLSSATSTSERLLSESHASSAQMVSEATMRADSMISDARTRADTMEREARTKAAALDRDAERRHVEALGIIEEKRGNLERRVEELHTYEREYRTRLRSYLDSQLRDLDSRGPAEPSSNR